MALARAENVVVEFPIYGGRSRSLKNVFVRAATGGALGRDAADRIVVRALDHVSFEFREGDRVGIVGHNGSGKSTLLRVLAGAYEPIDGSIEVVGRVASMLNIELGMDVEATGYENIIIRGTIMGMRPRDMEARAAEIAEFAELGDYLDVPVRTYSSGMAMRLAFAVSTSVPAEVILMDEWLAVGDKDFAEKAQKRLRTMVDDAKILFLATHDADLIRNNCNKILRLDHGKVASIEKV